MPGHGCAFTVVAHDAKVELRTGISLFGGFRNYIQSIARRMGRSRKHHQAYEQMPEQTREIQQGAC